MQIVIVILWDGYYLYSYLGDGKKSCMTHSRNARLRNRRCVVGQWKGMNMGTSFKVFPRNWEEKKGSSGKENKFTSHSKFPQQGNDNGSRSLG